MPIITENWKMRPRHNQLTKLIRKYYKIRVNLTKPRHPIPDSEIRHKIEQDGQLVIQIPFGGLGDHLAYSSLPELLWKQKGIKTCISEQSIFRSKAIHNFVWGLNPYAATTTEKGWFMYQSLPGEMVLDEYLHKLFGVQARPSPIIYYTPNPINNLNGRTLVHASFGPAGKANGHYEPAFHNRFIEHLEQNAGDFVLLLSRHSAVRNPLETKIIQALQPPCYDIGCIEELADAMHSARQRYLMYSGAASLVAAMELESIILCNRKASPNFQYHSNNYIDLMR